MAAADWIGENLISARSFDEYRAMFAVTAAVLTGSLLGRPRRLPYEFQRDG